MNAVRALHVDSFVSVALLQNQYCDIVDGILMELEPRGVLGNAAYARFRLLGIWLESAGHSQPNDRQGMDLIKFLDKEYGPLLAEMPSNSPRSVKTGSRAFLDPLLNDMSLSWLRCMWHEVYYLSRYMYEDRSQCTETTMEKAATSFQSAAEQTIKRFREFLEFYWVQKAEIPSSCQKGNMPVTDKWLWIWFLIELLEDEKYQNGLPSAYADERLQYFESCSTLALYLIHLIRYHNIGKGIYDKANDDIEEERRVPEWIELFGKTPADVPDALTKLICVYCYHSLGVPREFRLEFQLKRLYSREYISYGISTANRDHLYHSIEVCILGHLLAKSLVNSDQGLKKLIARDHLETQFLKYWYPAALLHDVGYAFQLVDDLPGFIKDLRTSGVSEVQAEIEQRIRNGKDLVQKKMVDSLSENMKADPCEIVRGDDHGAIGADHVLQDLIANGCKEEAAGEFAVSIEAILAHNNPDIKIECDKGPLTFILVLCDHLQEWGRARVKIDDLAKAVAASLKIRTPSKFERVTSVKTVEVDGKYNCSNNSILVGRRSGNRIEKLEFTLLYRAAEPGLVEPAVDWILLTRDLQRLKLDDLWPETIITLVHPPGTEIAQCHGPKHLSEFEILSSFAQGESGSFAGRWIE